MKKEKIKLLVLGIILLILSFVVPFALTYVFDYFEGHPGREMIIVMMIIIFTGCLLVGGGFLIIKSFQEDD